jgi:hypothetical protein
LTPPGKPLLKRAFGERFYRRDFDEVNAYGLRPGRSAVKLVGGREYTGVARGVERGGGKDEGGRMKDEGKEAFTSSTLDEVKASFPSVQRSALRVY